MTSSTSNGVKKFNQHQILIVTLLGFTQFSVVLDFILIAPLGDLIIKTFHITPRHFGFLVSSYALSAAISGFLIAGIADRFDRKKLLMFFYGGFIVATFCCAISPSYHYLLASRVITGIFGGVIGSISLTIVTDIFPLDMRGRALSILQMGFGVSQILGLPISLFLANKWGWHAPFIMLVALGLCVSTALLLFLQPIREHLKLQQPRTAKLFFLTYKEVVTQKKYLQGFITTALVTIGGFLIQPFASTFLINNLGVPPTKLPIIFLFAGIASCIAILFSGKISDKYSRFTIFTVASIVALITVLIYTNLTAAPLWLITAISMILFAFLLSRVIPAMALISALPAPSQRGTFMSLNAALQQVAGGFGTMIAGLIVSQDPNTYKILHYNMVGLVVAVIMIVCIYLVFRVNRIVGSLQRQTQAGYIEI